MLLGMMNDPRRDPVGEAVWAAENGFDFLDLTFEAPMAMRERLDVAALRQAAGERGLRIVGHTAWYLPFGSPFARLRAAAVEEVAACFDALAELGADRCNVHADHRGGSLSSLSDVVRWNQESFAALAERAAPFGITVMVEHVPNSPLNTVEAMVTLLAADPRLAFHFDAGHAHLDGYDKTEAYLAALGPRMRHVHLSDNKLHTDDHLPLGTGRIDWPRVARLLRAARYDDTVTLEIFTPDRGYLLSSAAKWRVWWGGRRAQEGENR
jgi:sugar phosphate isomerase/epimerase